MINIYKNIYKWVLLSEALLLSVMPLFSADNVSPRYKLIILFLEYYYYCKAVLSTLLRRDIIKEKFLGYTVYFPDYLEFVLLFINIFGVQEYRLKRKNVKTIIDAGSSWGMSVIYFKHIYSKSQIIAIEANRKTAQLLEKNVKINKLANVKIYNALVSGRKGMQDFYISKDGWSISDTAAGDFVGERDDFMKTRMRSVPLSEFINRKVDVIKMNIEGMEGEVLKEIAPRLENVSEIVLEYHSLLNVKRNSLKRIKQLLTRAGFTLSIHVKSSIIPRANSRKLRIIHAFRNR